MGDYRLSNECELDIFEIYEYGIEKFGLIQAQEYLIGLHDLFRTLAENTNIGRNDSEFPPSLKRFVYRAQKIFYLQTESGVFIVRTLNQSMDNERHLT
ncbi:MAG: type II toxin-antitoxin system RelE/ParE family toxin [Reichenbachiella sp.]